MKFAIVGVVVIGDDACGGERTLLLLLLIVVETAAAANVKAVIDENTIRPVASLKLASNSISVESCFGTFTLLNISITIAGSVGAISAANVKATENARPAIYVNNNPATSVATTTPIVAKSNADILMALNSL